MGSNLCSGRKDMIYSSSYQNSGEFQINYTFSQTIGRGCYSKVKLAFQNITHKKVAIKIIEKAQVLKNNLFLDIKREKQILQIIQSSSNKTKCPFITQIIECCQDFEHLYFVMEYAPRDNLRQLLKHKKTLSMQRIKFITVCILLALEHLEHKQIIHGDIKPQNILIGEDGYFQLADFSSAQFFQSYNKQIKGTKGYIAPQIQNNQKFRMKNNKSDLYSLGTTLWEMAYGTKYQTYLKNRESQLKDHELTGDSSDDSQDTPAIDSQFLELVLSLLRQNPQERPTIQQIWSHPWLNLSRKDLSMYLSKTVDNNPFHPLEEFFDYSGNLMKNLPKAKKNAYEQTDSLLSSVLLNQKRYQDLFASFSTPPVEKRRNRRSQL